MKTIINILDENIKNIDEIRKITENYTGIDLMVDEDLIKKWIGIYENREQEEQFWDLMIPIISEKSFTDNLLDYFLNRKISCISLAHKELPDKWLKKLIVFDDAALYQLVVRYYTDENICSYNFVDIARRYIISSIDIFSYLNELYRSSKQTLLLHLGRLSSDKQVYDYANNYIKAMRFKYCTDINEISTEYENNKENVALLLTLAENILTPMDILYDIEKITNIKYAAKIRKIARETIRIKKGL